ncbi:MAG: hypothetical protein KIT22_03205, partial [Verrucomicrobiae bacterium]|nr:hypothetical protein [Verrucomicrobiae bacterium]
LGPGAASYTGFLVKPVPVRADQVLVPSDLYLVGDSLLPVGIVFAGHFSFPNHQNLLRSPSFYDRMRAMEKRRHGGRFQVVLADSHVERLRHEHLFSTLPDHSRRWNRNHMPYTPAP